MENFMLVVSRFALIADGATDEDLAEAGRALAEVTRKAAETFALSLGSGPVRIEIDGEQLTRSQVRDRVFSAPERARKRAQRDRSGVVPDSGQVTGDGTLACA